MDGINITQLFINIITLSSFYACFAVGLALVFGVMKVINFAHGELYMLGGYTVWAVMSVGSNLPLPVVFIMALVIGPIAVGAIGIVIQQGIFRPLQVNPFAGFMASLGLAYALQVVAAKSFGVVSKSLPIIFPGRFEFFGGIITTQRFVILLFSIIMMTGLWYFLMQTRTGRAMRATAQNKDSALLQGISFTRMSALAMGVGAALAAISGSLMGSVINISPFMGLEAIWKAFIIVIVGGMGSIGGAVVAALLFGCLDSAIMTFGWGQFVIMIDTVIMLIVLAFFPQGLLGREAPALEQREPTVRVYERRTKELSGSAKTVALLIFMAIAIFIPYAFPGYLQDSLVLFMINVILVISYRFITTMGSWSFAHIAIMGLGGYTMAMLTTKYMTWSFWITIPIGGVVSAVFALAISYPVLRTRQFYFFLSTFAAGEALRQCFIQFKGVLGGIEGIPFVERPNPILGFDFIDTVHYYYLVLVVAILCAVILNRFDKSRIGRTIKTVAANDSLSESVGVNTLGYKAMTFAIGSFFAGVAGVLFANYNGFVAPTDYTTVFMFKIIASAIVGGTRTFAGPILGLIVLTIFQEIFRDVYQIIPLIWGVCIIGIMLFMPHGLESQLWRVFRLLDLMRLQFGFKTEPKNERVKDRGRL